MANKKMTYAELKSVAEKYKELAEAAGEALKYIPGSTGLYKCGFDPAMERYNKIKNQLELELIKLT